MVLIFVVLIVKNGGFFQQFSQALNTGTSGGTSAGSTSSLAAGTAKLASVASSLGTAFDVLSAVAV
jgi:hypothetical protein